jgi:uncharacterized integral membrane protein
MMPQETPSPTSGVDHRRRETSWGAIWCGALIGFAILTVFAVLAIAMGITVFESATNPVHPGPLDLTFILVTSAGSLFFAGFTASRLAGSRSPMNSALHGMSVWALVVVVSTASGALVYKDKTSTLFISARQSQNKNKVTGNSPQKTFRARQKQGEAAVSAAEARGPWTLFFTLLLTWLASFLGGLVGHSRSIARPQCTLQNKSLFEKTIS